MSRVMDRNCPNCGHEYGLRIIEIPEWEDEKLNVSITCWECDLDVTGVLNHIPERIDLTCVACNKTHRPLGSKQRHLCSNCSDKMVVFDTRFGLVIPRDTGIVYENQTDGVCCGRRYVEGSKIYLERPTQDSYGDNEIDEKYKFESEYVEDGDILHALTKANYEALTKANEGASFKEEIDEIWSDIDEQLWFDYEETSAPEGQQSSTEAFQWIKITNVVPKYNPIKINAEELVGEKAVLHYPNCD